MKPKKSLGQNFLSDNKLLSKIVDIGKISNNDTVLEIGPGTGNLTKEIIKKKPKNLIVVEKDEELSKLLHQKFGDTRIGQNTTVFGLYISFHRFRQHPASTFRNRLAKIMYAGNHHVKALSCAKLVRQGLRGGCPPEDEAPYRIILEVFQCELA